MKNKKPILYGLLGAIVGYLLLLLATILLGDSAEIVVQSPIIIRQKILRPAVRTQLEKKILEEEIRKRIEEELRSQEKNTSLALPEPARADFENKEGGNTIEEKIKAVFGQNWQMAKKVAFCESSLDPLKSHRTSSAKGLFQIIDSTWKHFNCKGDAFNPDDNIRCAYKIFKKFGWDSTASWRASKGCWSR